MIDITEDTQKLIDILFEISLRIHTHHYFKGKSNKEVAAWIRQKLENLGYPTTPMGISWGALTERIYKDDIKVYGA